MLHGATDSLQNLKNATDTVVSTFHEKKFETIVINFRDPKHLKGKFLNPNNLKETRTPLTLGCRHFGYTVVSTIPAQVPVRGRRVLST